MTQETLLGNLEQSLKDALETLRQELAPLDEATLQRRPDDPKRWNMLECFEHLNLHYTDYLSAIELGIHKAKAHKFVAQPNLEVKYTWLGRESMKWVEGRVSSKRRKTSKRYNPLGKPLSANALKSLIINIEKLLRIIHLSKEVDLNRTKVRFAVVPMFKYNLGNLLEFMAAHTQRHIAQALSLKK
jgi:hypothetical protein